MIEVLDLTYRYKSGDPPIFDELNETFRSGEMVGLCGPSGRGKSTLLYLLGLMLKPAGGEIVVDGHSTSQLNDRARSKLRAHLFGFVFQDAVLDPSRSVIDNVLEGSIYRGDRRRVAEEEARRLLEQFGVSLRAKSKPSQVSGGQAQRVSLCRALLSSPKTLLADEPTGNLDGATSSVVISALLAYADAGNTVVIATHDPHVMSNCSRVVML
jgi:ABC-type antimicrobial peptide transport system, ATPase component